MSIRQVQLQNVLDLVAKSYLVDGQSPMLDDIYRYLNRFFAAQKVGTPYQFTNDEFVGEDLSDPEMMNDFMAMMITNADTLYETCFNHVDQILVLNTVLRTYLDRLMVKRAQLNAKIDDYLLGIFNSDGYFYSVSDDFVSADGVDFNMTNAFVDTSSGLVTIPAISSRSRVIEPDSLSIASLQAYDSRGPSAPPLSVTQKTAFSDCLDGLVNTAWQLEVKTSHPGPVVLDLIVSFSDTLSDTLVTKVDVTPFGVEPIQCSVLATYQQNLRTAAEVPFSNQVKTSSEKMVFLASEARPDLWRLKFQIRKSAPDYVINDTRERTNVYLFGFRELAITEQYFDPFARLVTGPLRLDQEILGESVIDAVSLVVEQSLPNGTSIEYFVAADNPNAEDLSGFSWKKIEPLTDSALNSSQIVRFDGSMGETRMIRSTPRNDKELKLIDFNNTNPDLAKRNPTPSYFNQTNAYRVTKFTEDFIPSTLKLEEGLNSTKIYYTTLSEDAYTNGFAFWRDKFDNPGSYETTYGEIDNGHGFLYGADVGENGKSVYAETFVYVDEEQPVLLKECRKPDQNSKTWDVKVFLNGREIAALPVGTDKLTVPWKFRTGKNHVVVMANIPTVSSAVYAPYIGFFEAMTQGNLYDYGTVKLDDWVYVDNYKFEYNLTDDAKAFTFYNDEIVSRRKPTNNFRITFHRAAAEAPEAIRLRADLRRSDAFAHTTPSLDSYRIRFAYGE